MTTRINVSVDGESVFQTNVQQTTANRSNRLDAEQTKKTAKNQLQEFEDTDPKKDDPFFKRTLKKDPAAFARKKGALVAASFVGCSLDFSDYWNVQSYKGNTYKIRGCTDDGTFTAWQSAAFRHPWELVGSEYQPTAPWNYELLKAQSSVPAEGVFTTLRGGDGNILKTDPQKYGSRADCWTDNNYGDGWWSVSGSGYDKRASPQPVNYESPLDYNLTPVNAFCSEGLVEWEQGTNLYPGFLAERYAWNAENLSVAPFSYMLPFTGDKAFLVVACVGISCPLNFQYLQEYSVYSGTERSMEINFINPFGTDPPPDWKHGTYFATRSTWDNTGSGVIRPSAWNTSGSNVQLTEDAKLDLYDIHVYEVTPGAVNQITPPQDVIDNLRQFMHPHPAGFTRTERSDVVDEGSRTLKDESYGKPWPAFDTTELIVIDQLQQDIHRERGQSVREQRTIYPDLNGRFNSHVKQTMPLWDTWNERRCLALQYGFGQITTQNHSYLKQAGLLSYVWGVFGETYDPPDGENREWFKYYSPAIYEMIKGNGIAQDGYQQFLNQFPSGETIVTDPSGQQVSVPYPPRYVLDVTQSGPLKMTDPEQWPNSLPSRVDAAVNPDSLIDSGIEGGKVLDVATHIAYNWGNPWYCYDQLKELGFTNAELGERPSTNLSNGSAQ